MKKALLVTLAVFAVSMGYSQKDKFWSARKGDIGSIATDKGVARQSFPKQFDLYELNLTSIRQVLFNNQKAIITLPNTDGTLEQFEMYEASNFEPELQAQFPEIRAYSGRGITDKYATIKLSISPQGIQTMVFRTDKENEFIEPYSADHTIYAVFKSQRNNGQLPWTCSSKDKEMFDGIKQKTNNGTDRSNDGKLRTMRLAQSVTAEYSNYFGATSSAQVSLVLAAINNTLTRCNGVYEKDLGLHLNLIANNQSIIYYNASTDPYSPSSQGLDPIAGCTGPNQGYDCPGTWNTQLQSTLTNVIGEANYDIGHLFGRDGGGGNAGCIGCVCDALRSSNSTPIYQRGKGEGITSPADGIPQGDNFDIDYVVHEIGHQLGANHTFSFQLEGSGVNMEVGSGVTIMGYAGITNQDVASHSIDSYHAVSISQIQTNLIGKSCPVTTSISANNATPIANAGVDYTIPKSTPFILTGSATDANAADALTYSWEQFDNAANGQTGANSAASPTKVSGPNWRSYSPSSSPVRYFPRLSSVLANQQTTQGNEIVVEALSSVARDLNFRLTVRDNAPFSPTAPFKVAQTASDDMIVTIDDTRGPLTVTSQATAGISYTQNSTQTVTWNVNNTNTSTGGSNVDILLSTDGGQTFPMVLAANTPNDGNQTITIPNVAAQYCRIMVKASGNIFFNVNPQSFAIGYTITTTCNTYTNSTPLPIPDGSGSSTPGAVVSNTINVPATSGNISDVDVSLNVSHSWPQDLVIALNHPDATQVTLWGRACAGNDNFNITLSDGSPAFTCVADMTGTYSPTTPLSPLNGKPANGTWTLLAADFAGVDTGQINSWAINVCTQTFTLTTENFGLKDFTLYPNPNNGNFSVQFTSSTGNDIKIGVHDMRGRLVFEKDFKNQGIFNQNIQLNNVQTGVYMVTVQDGDRKEVKKISIR